MFTNKLLLWDFVQASGLAVTRLVPQRTVPGSSKLLSDKTVVPSYQALCRALKRRNRVALAGPAAIWIVQDVKKNPANLSH